MSETKELKNTAFRRVKYLSLMQMGDQLRAKKSRSAKKKAFITFLKACLTIAVTAVIMFALSFLNTTFQVKTSKELFICFIFILQAFTILSSISSMMSMLYTSKENTMLLVFPCTYGEIFLSKIVVFGIAEMKKSAYFLAPILLAFGLLVGGAAYWLLLLPMWFMLCMFPVLIGALLSIPLIYVKRFLERHLTIYAFLVVAFLAVAFIGVTMILQQLPDPLRLVAIYADFIKKVEAFLIALSKWSLWYIFIGKAMFASDLLLSLTVSLAVFAAVAASCFLLARPFYFKAVSSTTEAGRTKKHKQRQHKKNNLFLTFFRKELKLFFRNSQSVNSAVITILMLPFLVYVFNYILLVINKNLLGDFMSVAFNVMITINILSANNANVAAAISSEGNEFAVLKTAPSNTSVICWAKIAVTACVNMVALLLTFIMFRLITTLTMTDLILLAVLLIATTTGHILWSFQLDINNPRILDYATKGNNVVDNVNIGKAVVIGFITATLFGALAFLLLMDAIISGWVRLLAIAFAFLAARIYLLRRNIKVYFNEIQM